MIGNINCMDTKQSSSLKVSTQPYGVKKGVYWYLELGNHQQGAGQPLDLLSFWAWEQNMAHGLYLQLTTPVDR